MQVYFIHKSLARPINNSLGEWLCASPAHMTYKLHWKSPLPSTWLLLAASGFSDTLPWYTVASKQTNITLTLMLLVANLANTKSGKKPGKLLKPWHMGTHLRVLSESYLMNNNMARFLKVFASLCFRWSSLSMGRVKKHPLLEQEVYRDRYKNLEPSVCLN